MRCAAHGVKEAHVDDETHHSVFRHWGLLKVISNLRCMHTQQRLRTTAHVVGNRGDGKGLRHIATESEPCATKLKMMIPSMSTQFSGHTQ